MSYYPANNNLQAPLAYSQYPSLSLQQPSVSTQASQPLSSQLFISDVPQQTTTAAAPTRSYIQRAYQNAKTAITARRVAKTVVAVAVIAVIASFVGNAYQSTIAPAVNIKSVSAFCSESSPCSTGSPLSLLVNLEVGEHRTQGDWNFDINVFLPQNLTVNYEQAIIYQHIGQGRLVTRSQNSIQDLTANVATIQQLASKRENSAYVSGSSRASSVVGIIQLPASSQTDSVITKMMQNGVFGSTVMVEVNTHIHQWFKDLQFATQATVSVVKM